MAGTERSIYTFLNHPFIEEKCWKEKQILQFKTFKVEKLINKTEFCTNI